MGIRFHYNSTTDSYKRIGRSICKATMIYLPLKIAKQKLTDMIQHIEERINELPSKPTNIKFRIRIQTKHTSMNEVKSPQNNEALKTIQNFNIAKMINTLKEEDVNKTANEYKEIEEYNSSSDSNRYNSYEDSICKIPPNEYKKTPQAVPVNIIKSIPKRYDHKKFNFCKLPKATMITEGKNSESFNISISTLNNNKSTNRIRAYRRLEISRKQNSYSNIEMKRNTISTVDYTFQGFRIRRSPGIKNGIGAKHYLRTTTAHSDINFSTSQEKILRLNHLEVLKNRALYLEKKVLKDSNKKSLNDINEAMSLVKIRTSEILNSLNLQKNFIRNKMYITNDNTYFDINDNKRKYINMNKLCKKRIITIKK